MTAGTGIDVDLAIVGGGGAGMLLLHQLGRHGPAGLRVAVVDPVDRLRDRPADRTWCFWHDPADGPGEVAAAVHASWRRMAVVAADGTRQELDLDPLRYQLVRSPDLYRLVADQVQDRLDVAHVAEPADTVQDGAESAMVRTAAGAVRARWVFDSRPRAPARPARTALLQHFRGVEARTAYRPVDAQMPVLLDFRVPQPPIGMAFGYVLPLGDRESLVEYTEFSPAVLDEAGYEQALGGYLPLALGPRPAVVGRVESGAIPMTDAVHARRAGRRVFLLGTAGGATRASTGYTFAAMLRQACAVARALTDGREPLPPRPYPRRHDRLDAVFLHALADGTLDGPAFFTRLFERNPPARVLRFLDGTGSLRDDLRVVTSAPWPPMMRSAARLAVTRRTG